MAEVCAGYHRYGDNRLDVIYHLQVGSPRLTCRISKSVRNVFKRHDCHSAGILSNPCLICGRNVHNDATGENSRYPAPDARFGCKFDSLHVFLSILVGAHQVFSSLDTRGPVHGSARPDRAGTGSGSGFCP